MTMAMVYKPLTADRIEDMTLGAFDNLRLSETLNHLIQYLSTWSGSEYDVFLSPSDCTNCAFMTANYSWEVLIPILEARARHQYCAGVALARCGAMGYMHIRFPLSTFLKPQTTSGMLPIIQWLIALERAPTPTRRLLTIERTQGWSMHAFFPPPAALLPPHERTRPLCVPPPHPARWQAPPRGHPRRRGITVVDAPLDDTARARNCSRRSAKLARRWDAWYNELAVNLSYLPMTIHGSALSSPLFSHCLRNAQLGSLEKGRFGNSIWVSLFGFAAAIASFRSGWKATALPPPPPPAESSEDAPE
ncbi:hypothetical protein EDB89DRAFT_2206507 [Lactarius sanguifluus]|nr:hypothetical protein EDB89DRAFT_2206507 [Lactarius sanguifluus]